MSGPKSLLDLDETYEDIGDVLTGDEGYEPTIGVSLTDDGSFHRSGPGRRKRKTVDVDTDDQELPDEPPEGWAEP